MDDMDLRERCSSGVSSDMLNSFATGGRTGDACALICAARVFVQGLIERGRVMEVVGRGTRETCPSTKLWRVKIE